MPRSVPLENLPVQEFRLAIAIHPQAKTQLRIVGIRRDILAGFSERDGPTLSPHPRNGRQRSSAAGGRRRIRSLRCVARVARDSTPVAGVLRLGVSDQDLVAGAKQERVRRGRNGESSATCAKLRRPVAKIGLFPSSRTIRSG